MDGHSIASNIFTSSTPAFTTTMTDKNNLDEESLDYSDFEGIYGSDMRTLTDAFTILRLCLAVFGVLANSLTCFVLTSKKLWSPTSFLLLTLVAYDALFLLASIPMCVINAFFIVDMETFAVICGVFYPIRYMAQTGSIYTTVTLTIERYLIVLRPLKTRIFFSFGKIRRFIIVIFFFSIIFNIPRCFFYNLVTYPVPMWRMNTTSNVNQTTSFLQAEIVEVEESKPTATVGTVMSSSIVTTQTVVMSEELRSYHKAHDTYNHYKWLYTRVYELYVCGVFFYLLPYILIPLLNFQLLLVIKKRRHETRQISLKKEHQRPNMTNPTNKVDGLTMIVLGITFCFFTCCLIPAVYNVTQIANVPSTNIISTYLFIASDTMLCINASTDFFFYCLLGAKFRNTFLHMFCKQSKCVQKSSPYNYVNSRQSDTMYHSI